MKAIRQYEFGSEDVLHWEEVPDPAPAEGEVRIAVEFAGVHLLDTSIRAGEGFGLGDPPRLPMTPGREVAGIVDATGEGVDPAWSGRRVVAHLAAGGRGGYAERAVVAADRVHPVPDGLGAEVAVASIGTGRTAAGILHQAPMRSGQVVVVTAAAGGLGLLLVQEAVRVGAHAVALAGGAEKGALARKHGAELSADYREAGWSEALSAKGVQADLVYDGVGGAAGLTAYSLLRDGGRLVRYGWASGEQVEFDDPGRPVVDVLGPAMLSLPGGLAALETEAIAAAVDGSRVPWVGSVFPMERAAEAHRALVRRETTGKVVLRAGSA